MVLHTGKSVLSARESRRPKGYSNRIEIDFILHLNRDQSLCNDKMSRGRLVRELVG
jgi:hypothetical protein